jgi:hypothetical protein
MVDVAAGDTLAGVFVAAFVVALARFASGLVAAAISLQALDDKQ